MSSTTPADLPPAPAGDTAVDESKPTPGPWHLAPNGPCFNLHSRDDGKHFCILIGMERQHDGEHAANARLIAAAPDTLRERDELLAACKLYVAYVNKHFDVDTYVSHGAPYDGIRAAIAGCKP